MKETELKLGDLVAYKDKVGKVDVYVPPVLYVDAEGESISTILADSDLQPIPLTEEILEKNGWKKQCSNLDMPGWSNNHVKLYPQDKKFGGGFSFFYSGNSVQYIHHVHQLQHILWALGIDDNLKI